MPVMAASSVLFSAMSLLIPLTRSVNTSLVASARFVTGIVVILGLALAGFTRMKPVNRWWLIVRGLIGATSVYFFFRGITILGLGKGTVLNYTYPVFAALLAPLMLKEKLSWDVVAAVLVSFVGIALVVNPGRLNGIGVEELLALLGGILSGVAVVAIKKLRETDTPYCHLSCPVPLRPARGRVAHDHQPFRLQRPDLADPPGRRRPGHSGAVCHDLGIQARAGNRGKPPRFPRARCSTFCSGSSCSERRCASPRWAAPRWCSSAAATWPSGRES